MPHIVFTNANFSQDSLKLKKLNEDLSESVKSPADWFTFTFLAKETQTFQLGEDITNNIIFVEIKWFERPDEVKQKVSDLIANYLKSYDLTNVEIVITFTPLTKSSYFEY